MPNVSEPIRLIGNPEENFYTLGRKHQTQFQQWWNFCFFSDPLQSPLQRLKDHWLNQPSMGPGEGPWSQWLISYCEGLEVPPARYLKMLAKLEAGLAPPIRPFSISAFHWSETLQGTQHLRIIDWPRAFKTAEDYEVILLEAPHLTPLLLIGMPGLPFLPLTAMNGHGLTIAVQPKYQALTHPEGRPVGEVVLTGLLASKNVNELRRQLKTFQTQSLWGISASDTEGMVLAMDIAGPQIDSTLTNLRESQTLILTQAPLVPPKESIHNGSPTSSQINELKKQWCLERLKRGDRVLLNLLRSPKAGRQTMLSGLSAASIQALTLTPNTRSLELLSSDSPGEINRLIWWQDLFHTQLRNHEERAVTLNKEERLESTVRHHYAIAQKAMDEGHITEAFHHLQMGLAQAQGESRSLGNWVWAWWQWRHLKGQRDQLYLYQDTKEVMRRIMPLHRPLIHLLRQVLELDLGLAATVTPMDLPAPLRGLSDQLLTAPPILREKMLAELCARLDLQDLAPLSWTMPKASR